MAVILALFALWHSRPIHRCALFTIVLLHLDLLAFMAMAAWQIPRLGTDYAIWMGTILPPKHYQEKYATDDAMYIDEVPGFVKENIGKVGNLYVLHGLNTDSGLYTMTTATFEGIDEFPVDKESLHPHMTECRVFKSAAEIDILRHVSQVSSAAHVDVMRYAKPSMTEVRHGAASTNSVISAYQPAAESTPTMGASLASQFCIPPTSPRLVPRSLPVKQLPRSTSWSRVSSTTSTPMQACATWRTPASAHAGQTRRPFTTGMLERPTHVS